MLHDPSLILLDPPYTGLDANAVETLNQMLDEAAAAGKTIILTTHDLEQGLRAATRAVIIDRGKIVFEGTAKDQAIRDAYSSYIRVGLPMMKPITAIIFKDIVIELRSKESISSMLMFGILVLVIFMFAFESSGLDKRMIGPGELW